MLERLIAISLFFFVFANRADAQKLEAEIFLPKPAAGGAESISVANSAEARVPQAEIFIGPFGAGSGFINENADPSMSTFYERDLARFRDITTLPQSRMECVKWASGSWPWGGGWKTCVGHKYQTRWLYATAKLRVDTVNQAGIKAAVDDCLRAGAVLSAAAAIVSGGAAALSTAETVIKVCLAEKLAAAKLVNVSLKSATQWGDWE